MPQLHDGEQLARDVAVLAPRADLVVIELGIEVPERRRLRILVDVALPPVRRDRAELTAAVDERDRAPDLARRAHAQGWRHLRRSAGTRRAGAASCSCAITRLACAPARQPAAEQRDRDRCDERSERRARQVARRAREMEPVVLRARPRRARRHAKSQRVGRRPCRPRLPSRPSLRCRPSTRPRTRGCRDRRTRARGICLCTVIGTGTSSLNAAAVTSPEMPEPPMPMTRMLRIDPGRGTD